MQDIALIIFATGGAIFMTLAGIALIIDVKKGKK